MYKLRINAQSLLRIGMACATMKKPPFINDFL